MDGRGVKFCSAVLLAATLTAFVGPSRADQPARTKVSEAKADADGILVHTVECECQDRPTTVRVLLPTKPEEGRRYPVLYVLPVEAGDGSRYGDGLLEVKKLGLHDRYGLVCVQPTFARLPWYADHPTDKGIRQEAYLLDVVLPLVEGKYPVLAKPEGRLLLGFSKSGWGAFSLLLRHPDTFGKAAAWDAPLDMDRPGKFGSGEIFGDDATFRQYQITRLLEERAGKLGDGKRLAVLGYGNFRKAHEAVHDLMDRLKVAHEYQDGPERKHDWHSGWVAGAVEFLAAGAGK
jgi:S-formylglutathione hydrolase FrmB